MGGLPKRFATSDYRSPASPFAHLCPALTGLEIRGIALVQAISSGAVATVPNHLDNRPLFPPSRNSRSELLPNTADGNPQRSKRSGLFSLQ